MSKRHTRPSRILKCARSRWGRVIPVSYTHLNIAIPGGDLDNGSQTLAVRTDGEYSSIDDVKNALISLPAGGTVRLSQIADVSMQPKDQDAISKVDGEECIILSVKDVYKRQF